MYRIDAQKLDQWELVRPKGGPVEKLFVSGHSMSYYEENNVLILFGGIRRDVARFSQLSGLMFQFQLELQVWTQLKLEPRSRKHQPKMDQVPPERAFHSAHLMGNYLVIFGGFSHKHNEVEACYDEGLYFFHLGCHTWVSRRILEHSPQGRAYPKGQGLFGHASTLRGSNVLIISGRPYFQFFNFIR